MKAYIVLIGLLLLAAGCQRNLDGFAQCLTTKNATMYGAYWCPHCQNTKAEFGKSWGYVNYVECATPGQDSQNVVCDQAGIEGYPTWVFADGTRKEGELTFSQLSDLTNCPQS